VESNVNYIPSDYARRGDTRQVVNAKARIKFTEQLVSIVGKPAFVPEFENSDLVFGQNLHKSF
jgi:hypothetical protein